MGPAVAAVLLIAVIQTEPAQTEVQPSSEELAPPPDRYCLACLCTAASGCDLSTGCTQDDSRPVCGPFLISEPFWRDSRIADNARFSSFDFAQCATDVDCAAATVTSYMSRFGQDCDEDGEITCRDYGLAHWLGYTGCTEPTLRAQAEGTAFFRKFMQCLQDLDSLLVAGLAPQNTPGCQLGANRL